MNDLLQQDRCPLFVIAGPCVIEGAKLCLQVARHVKEVCERLGLAYIFKASFDKANRSSVSSYRGPGLTEGLEVLSRVKREAKVRVLTDIHEADQAAEAGKVVDVLQIPAFLSRQTDLLAAAGRTGRVVNIKKGQFMSPQEMLTAVEKVRSVGNRRVMLTERGTFFGYNRLVTDFRAIPQMRALAPVVFDATHSVQEPGGLGSASGGERKYAPVLAFAAMAAGADALFVETHPDPDRAKSDAPSQMPLSEMEPMLRRCLAFFETCRR